MQIVYLPAGKAIDQQTRNGLARLIVQLDKHVHASCIKSKFSQYRLDSDAVLLSRAMKSLTSFRGGPKFNYVVAKEYGEIVACLGYSVSDCPMGYYTIGAVCSIGQVVTDEQHRGSGIMTALINDVLTRVRRENRAAYADLWVSAFNQSAERYWRHLGFDMELDKYATVSTRSIPNTTPPCAISKYPNCEEVLRPYACDLSLIDGLCDIDRWIRTEGKRTCTVFRCAMLHGNIYDVVCINLSSSHVCYIECIISGDPMPGLSEIASIVKAVDQVTRKDIVMIQVRHYDQIYGDLWRKLPWMELSDIHLAKEL